MSQYPDYVPRLLAQARAEGQWHAGQADAAALCFDVLALFPECREASDLVYELFCDEWTIYDMRNAVQQHIDEWDDQPHQQRRRLALSCRFMSRWTGWDREFEKGRKPEREGPKDVRALLQQGHMQLLEAYCLGDDECLNYAWPKFTEAIEKTRDPQTTLLWIGKQYADLGFFADAAEVLLDLCSRYKDEAARRLLAEVRWWRDNAPRIPWIPPAGDGSRYRRMMQFIDPTAPTHEEVIQHTRARLKEVGNAPTWQPIIDPELAKLFGEAVPAEISPPAQSVVDWSFLDRDDGQPGELPVWAKKMMKLFRDNPEHVEDIAQRHRWSRPIPQPKTPKRYDPNEPPFDPSEVLGGMSEEDFDFDDDEE
ncbi:MAG: hypothetical protein HY327_04250 [Chloroflexi bacterium]|nr:hypothetical protein [Chloroflexota bacterium]